MCHLLPFKLQTSQRGLHLNNGKGRLLWDGADYGKKWMWELFSAGFNRAAEALWKVRRGGVRAETIRLTSSENNHSKAEARFDTVERQVNRQLPASGQTMSWRKGLGHWLRVLLGGQVYRSRHWLVPRVWSDVMAFVKKGLEMASRKIVLGLEVRQEERGGSESESESVWTLWGSALQESHTAFSCTIFNWGKPTWINNSQQKPVSVLAAAYSHASPPSHVTYFHFLYHKPFTALHSTRE